MLKMRHRYALIALALAGFFLTGLAGSALAQSQDDSAQSVAEAARRAREKKKAAAKPAKTLTEDDLPAAPVAGSANASAAANPAKTDDSAAPTAAATAKPADAASVEKAKLEYAANVAALDRAKKSLVQSEGELDVMQRKAKLDSDSYYSKPDFSGDTNGKAKLDAEAQNITTKQEDIETLKARITELQAAVDAGAPPATESKPPLQEKPPSQ